MWLIRRFHGNQLRKYVLLILIGCLASWVTFGLWTTWLEGDLHRPLTLMSSKAGLRISRGYSGTADARADVGKITGGQAWLTYAMAGRAASEAGITKGLNVFLRGRLWDLSTD